MDETGTQQGKPGSWMSQAPAVSAAPLRKGRLYRNFVQINSMLPHRGITPIFKFLKFKIAMEKHNWKVLKINWLYPASLRSHGKSQEERGRNWCNQRGSNGLRARVGVSDSPQRGTKSRKADRMEWYQSKRVCSPGTGEKTASQRGQA